ncbi:MAG: adenylate/guanylate cyclase domain-containing protein [Actinobacteria bacterium]|nr:MAG: adenylate/guanylate cyclase domain-containing protein [Actinomycetota bacterium]
MDRDDILGSARRAAADHAWEEAFAAYRAADALDELSPEDLEALSIVAFCASRMPEAVDARQRAYVHYERAGRTPEAASAALNVALLHFGSGNTSAASGWLGRAQRLLDGVPETAAHALLAWIEGQTMARLKAFEQAQDKAREMEAIAGRVGDPDLLAMGISMQGYLRTLTGDVAAGLALIDEALTAVLAGQMGPLASAEIFCEMVVSCIEAADFQRAAEWLDTAERAGRQLTCFPGCCRVHRATVLRHHGEWQAAQEHAKQGRSEVAGLEVIHEGMALTELGELHRCKGEIALAEQEFGEAYEKGWPPQPGMALLRLRNGDVDAAKQVIGRAVDWAADELPALVRLLPAQVEIAIAAGDSALVETAAARLADVASRVRSSTAAAASAFVTGLLERQRGNLTAAARQLELSVRAWQQVRSPYDAARARMRLADVLADLGDAESARLELAAARATFERLGATPEAREAARRLGDDAPRHATRTFMFTDIVDSTALLSAIGDEAWDGVRRWHDRMVNTAVAEHRGSVVKGTGDGYFVTFEEPTLAADCAIAIQRALDDHRRRDGFSPSVRIGLHVGSAVAAGDDYSGRDVVIAARVAALAQADEILVSAAVADQVQGHVAAESRRSADLKGIREPVDVAAIVWR